jgi:hypothetical protein
VRAGRRPCMGGLRATISKDGVVSEAMNSYAVLGAGFVSLGLHARWADVAREKLREEAGSLLPALMSAVGLRSCCEGRDMET